jgi:hypothetical protein
MTASRLVKALTGNTPGEKSDGKRGKKKGAENNGDR